MSDLHYFDDLHEGDRWTSEARVVTAEDVSGFAHLTGDLNPIHIDPEFAAETPFGQPIAHGLLGLSFMAGLASTAPQLDTIALLSVGEWQFLKPIYYGDHIHVVSEIVKLTANGRKRGRVVWQKSLVNQQGISVQEGSIETLVRCRPIVRKAATEGQKLQIPS